MTEMLAGWACSTHRGVPRSVPTQHDERLETVLIGAIGCGNTGAGVSSSGRARCSSEDVAAQVVTRCRRLSSFSPTALSVRKTNVPPRQGLDHDVSIQASMLAAVAALRRGEARPR
jgi:hypothetical protein